MKKIFFILILLFTIMEMKAQNNVGIGTTTPNEKAILDIKATDKGVLFPSLTTAQRDAITDPPNGLHIFNTDEHCLNFYDAEFNIWNSYCNYITTIRISQSTGTIDFSTYANTFSGKKEFNILIDEGVTISGGIIFSSIPSAYGNYEISIINKGFIYGTAGTGGEGASGANTISCPNSSGQNGQPGGNAITTNSLVKITINNYGVIAAGGGGGGGGGRSDQNTQLGGGGGGGAGLIAGGAGGFGGNDCQSHSAANGQPGTTTTGGIGGAGYNGGGAGGNGGGIASPGQNGTGIGGGSGGIAGKAIAGGSGNVINNISGGQSFGAVD
jgi:hypothetical protein